MRAAPPVVHSLADSGPWVWAAASLAATATATPFVWLTWHLTTARLVGGFELAVLAVVGLSALVLAVTLAARAARRRRGEQLRWDGGRWQLLDAKGHAWLIDAPTIEIDLGGLVLLRSRHALDGAAAWLPLQRSDGPRSWHGLRVALSQPPVGRPAPTPGGAA